MTLLDVLLAAARAPKPVAVAPVSGYAAYVAAFEAAEAARPVCRRCQGTGYLREYAHNGGVCYACGGYVRAAAVPMTEAEWLREQAIAAGFGGFDVMVQR